MEEKITERARTERRTTGSCPRHAVSRFIWAIMMAHGELTTMPSMFHQLLFIHLYRPFLKYTKSNSPLPPHVSPRKICVHAASVISKLLRVYKRTYGFSQVVNFVVYIAHTVCTVHILNLPEKNAQRDIIHGFKHLEEMGESWLCARRTLRILDISAYKWQASLPSEAIAVIERTHAKWGSWGSWDQASSPSVLDDSPAMFTSLSPATAPSTFSSPGGHVPSTASQHHNPYMQASPTHLFPMSSYYPPTATIPSPTPTMSTAQRPIDAQFQQRQFALPEPTYLRPMANVHYPLQMIPLQQEAWYGNSPDNHLSGIDNKPDSTSPPATSASPMAMFDAPGNSVVEASRDWWSRDHNVMPLGMNDHWEQGWSPNASGGDNNNGDGLRFPTYGLPHDNNHVGVGARQESDNVAVGTTSASSSSQPLGIPVVPTLTTTEPGSDFNVPTGEVGINRFSGDF